MSDIHLLLVDDHEVVRTGLRMLLESQSDIKILAEASTGAEAIQMASEFKPDVVVMDITLPDITGIEATRRLKERHPEIAVVALTIHEDEQYFFEMLQAGASGYVPNVSLPKISSLPSGQPSQVRFIFILPWQKLWSATIWVAAGPTQGKHLWKR